MQTVIVALIVAWAAWRVWLRFGPRTFARHGGGKSASSACGSCGSCGDGKGCAPTDERPVMFHPKR